jgi:hypothetical protein
MAAGLGFKTFAVGEVLTAGDTNGYLMQGVLVFASATARDAAITSPQEGQFAYLKDTNVTTYYTGSAWANLDTTGMVNPMTTTGDTIYSSSGSTPARLAIGSTGQVLTVAGGVPTWASASAGGASYSLLNTGGTSLTGSSITISGISGKETIYVILSEVQIDTSEATMQLRINSDSTSKYEFYGTSYTAQSSYASTLFGTTGSGGTPTTQINLAKRSDAGTTIARGGFTIQGANATGIKTVDVACGFSAGSGTFNTLNNFKGIYTGTSTVSSITILTNSGSFSAGTVYVYTTA